MEEEKASILKSKTSEEGQGTEPTAVGMQEEKKESKLVAMPVSIAGYDNLGITIYSQQEGTGAREESKQAKGQLGVPVLYRAQSWKFKAIMKLIDERKLSANVLLEKDHGWRLIHYVVMQNKVHVLNILIKKFDCDINVPDAHMQTPLHLAAVYGKAAVFKLLLQQPLIQLELMTEYQCTALMNTVKGDFLAGFIYLRLEKEANLNTVDSDGFSVVHMAAFKNNTQFLRLLQALPGVDFTALDKEGLTPLYRAIASLSYNSVKFLVSQNPTVLHTKLQPLNLTPCEYAKKLETQPHIISYLEKQTELANIQKEGVFSCLRSPSACSRLRFVLIYLGQTYGRYIFLTTFGLLLGCMLLSFWVFGRPGAIESTGFTILVCGLIATLITFMVSKDPGYVEKKQFEDPTSAFPDIVDKIKNDEWPHCDRHCFNCLIVQQDSVQHCEKCNRCVEGFQRHLHPLFSGQCIGNSNFPLYFLLILLTLITFQVYIEVILCAAMSKANSIFPINVAERYYNLACKSPFIAILVAILTFCSIQVAYRLFILVITIMGRITMDEFRHPHLYRYLFRPVQVVHTKEFKYVWIHLTFRERCRNLYLFLKSLVCFFTRAASSSQLQYLPLLSLLFFPITLSCTHLVNFFAP